VKRNSTGQFHCGLDFPFFIFFGSNIQGGAINQIIIQKMVVILSFLMKWGHFFKYDGVCETARGRYLQGV